MAGITSAMTTSFRQELMAGGHCFNATVTATANSSSSTAYTAASSLAGVAVGMAITGTSVGANSVVSAISSATAFTSSVASTGTITGGTLTFTGDSFKCALITGTPTGTYGLTSVNYTDITGNSDETSGTGYTATGFSLVNVTPVGSAGVGYVTFNTNPSWTSATFTTSGCMIYNASTRNGGTSGTNTAGGGRAVAVFSFGSVITASSSTLTIILPVANTASALLRLS